MARAYQVVSVGFLLLGLFVLWQSIQLRYFSRLGPGPGFFGVWLGGLVAVLAVILLVQNTLPRWRPTEPLEVLPPREARAPLAMTVASLPATVLLLPLLGFRLTALGLCLFLLLAVGRQPWWLSGVVALACSFGVHYVFTALLGVVLPTGAIGI
jgi:putative tricarboxylic transport membrane protein